MAYFRPGHNQLPPLSPSKIMASQDFDSIKNRRTDESSRPLIIFSYDISHWSPVFQYVLLAGGLILFMCLYGYYQELVQYGWFDRKLSLFSTFLHFLGVSIFAQLQRNVLNKTNQTNNGGVALSNASFGHSFFSMGTAAPRTAIFYYIVLVLVKVVAQGMSNLSMTQINYPAKVLFKSANPIVTMIIGVTWFRRSYPLRDYFVVLLLVAGLYVFIATDSAETPTSTSLGILYVVISMFGSAGVPMIQEHVIGVYGASVEDLLYHSFLGSTVVSLFLSLLTGELFQGVSFLLANSSIHVWLIFAAFCTFGFCGANFSTALTHQYGALVNGITNTFRKAITLLLSFVLFPERNTLSQGKLLGAAIFFAGLLVRMVSKGEKSTHSHSTHVNMNGNSNTTNSVSNKHNNNNSYARLNGSTEETNSHSENTTNSLLEGRSSISMSNLTAYNENDDEVALLIQSRSPAHILNNNTSNSNKYSSHSPTNSTISTEENENTTRDIESSGSGSYNRTPSFIMNGETIRV